MKVSMKNLFDYTPTKAIIKNAEALNPDSNFIPDEIPFREKQALEIADILKQILLGMNTGNAILRGATGTGKTITMKYVLSAFEEHAKKHGLKIGIGYASGHILGDPEKEEISPHRYIAELMNSMGLKIKASKRGGYGWGGLLDMFRDYLNEQDYDHIIFVLDDIHRLKDVPFFMSFARPQQVWNLKTKLTVFYITSTERFVKMIPLEGAYSFANPKIFFEPYNAKQLQEIIKQRLHYALDKPEVIPEDAITLIAAIGAQSGGNAKYTLRVLREFVNKYIMGYYEGMNVEKAVYNASTMMDIEDYTALIKSMSFTSKAILASLILYEYQHGFPSKEYPFSKVYKIYQSFCKNMIFKVVSPRTFDEHLYALINNYLLEHRRGMRGRQGTVKLEMGNTLRIIVSALVNDEYFDSLKVVLSALDKKV